MNLWICWDFFLNESFFTVNH